MLTNNIDQNISENILLKAAFYEQMSFITFLQGLCPNINKLKLNQRKQPSIFDSWSDDKLFYELIRLDDLFSRDQCSVFYNPDDPLSVVNTIDLWSDITEVRFVDDYYFYDPKKCYYKTISPFDVVNYDGTKEPILARTSRGSNVPFCEILNRNKEQLKKKIEEGPKDGNPPKVTDQWIANEIGIYPSHLSEMKRIPGCGKYVRPVSVSHLCGFCVVLRTSPQEAWDSFHDCMTTNELSDYDLISQALLLCLEEKVYNYAAFVELAMRAWFIFHDELPKYARKSSLWKDSMTEAEEWMAEMLDSEKFKKSGARDLREYASIIKI